MKAPQPDNVATKPMKIGITGSEGLIGWHTRALLHGLANVETKNATRTTFQSPETLQNFVSECDAIIHLAGMNRGDEAEVARVNVELVQNLIEACRVTEARPHIVFASSTHIFRDTAYGKSKRVAAEKFQLWAQETGGKFSEMVLPHVFGESGKPFYNSAVSTFCHQLANGEAPKIIQDGDLELVHAGEVAERALAIIQSKVTGRVSVSGFPITVSHALARLQEFYRSYVDQQTIPAFPQTFDLQLFNTLRSFLYPQHYPVALTLHADARGNLFESVKTLHGGQAFVSTTRPGITRGNHYHRQKIERFCVIRGRAEIKLRRLFSESITTFAVSGETPVYVDMPTLHPHNITNTGSEELITLFWSHEIFDRNRPDTFSEQVQP